jgi:hypothetical protein
MECSRSEVQKICKAEAVSGSVTRDNINSILITLSHPSKDHVKTVYDYIKAKVQLKFGYVDDEKMVEKWGFGTLDSAVRTHKGTARREDNVPSWEDGDSKNGSTYNAPPNLQSKSSMAPKKVD